MKSTPTNRRPRATGSEVDLNDLYGEFKQIMAAERAKPTLTREEIAALDNDLLAWSKHFLPHYFTAPPSKMHREIAAILDANTVRRPRPAPPTSPP